MPNRAFFHYGLSSDRAVPLPVLAMNWLKLDLESLNCLSNCFAPTNSFVQQKCTRKFPTAAVSYGAPFSGIIL